MHDYISSVNHLNTSVTSIQQRADWIQRLVVTAEQMRTIEGRVFAAGMPVAALMEKVAGLITQRMQVLYPLNQFQRVGILVGPGHNGGDALVVARELHFRGYQVLLYCPFTKLKELTASHVTYATSLSLPFVEQVEALQTCDVLIDGLFGFGLERPIVGEIAQTIDQVNQWSLPILSIDLPSGLHTDKGEVLGTAIRASQTLCLGLWKQGIMQDHALAYLGKAELIDFDLPLADIAAVLGDVPMIQRITDSQAIAHLPLQRSSATHKYQMGHLLLVAGSRRYPGAAILSGLAARATGVGMLTIVVPDSIRPLLLNHLPDAVVIGAAETEVGTIAPDALSEISLEKYNAVACGPGLTTQAVETVETLLTSDRPLVLDADGLNILADLGMYHLGDRAAPTVLTPHWGEFKRLFPSLVDTTPCRITLTQQAAHQSKAIVLLKGARVAIADATGCTRINPKSTPALARGGSGDVLTGLIGGLLAQAIAIGADLSPLEVVQAATWWHAQAGVAAAHDRTEMGVDAFTLSQYLIPTICKIV